MFGVAKKPDVFVPLVMTSELPTPSEPPKPAWNYKEHVTALAREKEKEVRARGEKFWPTALKEHERDSEAFRFECKRWGDFLSIFVDRADRDNSVRKHATAINIGQSRAIHLWLGHEPDKTRVIHYRAMEWRADGKDVNTYGKLGESYGFQDSKYDISTDSISDEVPQRHSILERHDGDGGGGGRHDTWTMRLSFKTENFPREASDDRLVFSGAGLTLHTPAGFGRDVFNKIMRELAGETDIVDDSAEDGTLIRQGERMTLLVRCPSTGKPTLLAVPPSMRSAAEARAWTFGLKVDQLKTDVET